ncbi:MAG: enoyl-CoA hydratase/isomerase family protein, partial [Zoogloeaceae bacterium]|nr:enoyl-CoA hydratase/isomerase family protein [Zoogloeaceae bacterium]
MTYETLIFEAQDKIATVTLNRPAQRNALNQRMKEELSEIIDKVSRGDDIRVLVFTGAGDAFCAGTDLRERAAQSAPPAVFLSKQRFTQNLFRRLEKMEPITIAAINGPAFGGGLELALTCDLRLAGARAKMGLTEVGLGIIPMAGGTQRLPRLIGAARAKSLILTARRITAEQAEAIGLVDQTIPDENLISEAYQLAKRLVALPPLSVRLAKQVIDTGLQTDLDTAL